MNKIKILQINKFYTPVTGGVERVVQQIAEGLQGRIDMEVLACQPKGKGTVEKISGVLVHKAGSFGTAFSTPLSLQFFAWLRKLRKDRDILQIHMPFPLADVALRLFGFGGKVAVWWHADIVKQKRLLVLYKPFMLWLLRRADVIMVATQGHIDGSDFLPPFQKKCVIIPFGVDRELLQRGKKVQKMPPENPVQFLAVGRLVYYKGFDRLIKALGLVPDAQLTIIGSGHLETELRALAGKLGVAERVFFRTHVDDEALGDAFARCDVFVLPSILKTEAFGLVQIEAMAYGKPVINTDLPSGVPHVSLHGLTGLTVPPDDVPALAAAMNRLAGDPALRAQYGKAAQLRAGQEYSLDKMLDRVLAEYVRLVEPESKEKQDKGW